MLKLASIYGCRDTCRSESEGQYYAEVVSNAGDPDEKVWHATGWYASPTPALNEASAWMKDNGFENEPY